MVDKPPCATDATTAMVSESASPLASGGHTGSGTPVRSDHSLDWAAALGPRGVQTSDARATAKREVPESLCLDKEFDAFFGGQDQGASPVNQVSQDYTTPAVGALLSQLVATTPKKLKLLDFLEPETGANNLVRASVQSKDTTTSMLQADELVGKIEAFQEHLAAMQWVAAGLKETVHEMSKTDCF